MKKIYFLFFLLASYSITAQTNDVTFSVDMSGQTFTQAYVSGGFNGWSGTDNPLTDMGGGIWEVTLPIPQGEFEYKFTYDDWAGQDAFTQGDYCTITNYGNTNRRLVVDGADQTLSTVAFGSCASVSTGPHSVTFEVDMSGYGGSTANGVFINGENYNSQGIGNWCGSCTPMTDMGGGIWSVTLPLEAYAYQFKFTVDGWNDQEGFTPGDPGTSTDGTFTNRYISVDGPKTVSATWNAPEVLSTPKFGDKELSVYPNPSNNVWNIRGQQTIQSLDVYDVLGKQVMNLQPNSSDVTIDATSLPKGLYFARTVTELGASSLKLIKQ